MARGSKNGSSRTVIGGGSTAGSSNDKGTGGRGRAQSSTAAPSQGGDSVSVIAKRAKTNGKGKGMVCPESVVLCKSGEVRNPILCHVTNGLKCDGYEETDIDCEETGGPYQCNLCGFVANGAARPFYVNQCVP